MVTLPAEDEVRAAVARALGRASIPDVFWRRVDDPNEWQRFSTASKTERRDIVRDLAAYARTEIDFVQAVSAEMLDGEGERSGPARISGEASTNLSRDDLRVDDHEHTRARVFSELVAGAAEATLDWEPGLIAPDDTDCRSWVHAFRDDLLGGVLTAEQARAFVLSPASWALYLDPSEPAVVPRSQLLVEIRERKEWRDAEGWHHQEAILIVGPERERQPYKRGVPHGKSFPTIMLPIGEQGRYETIEYWEQSALGALHKLARRLSRSFPWTEGEAAWFTLTGVVPYIRPIQARYETRMGMTWRRGLLTLSVEPWVSTATIERIYLELRRRALPRDGRRREKGLAVWLFGREQERAAGQALSGRELQQRWNADHPDDRYESYSGLRRARNRGEVFAQSIRTPVYAPNLRADGETFGTPFTTPKPVDDGGNPRMG